MTYDTKCYELAAHFLSDHEHEERDVVHLARSIQRSVEDWLEWFAQGRSFATEKQGIRLGRPIGHEHCPGCVNCGRGHSNR